jgi:hypothetical protein
MRIAQMSFSALTITEPFGLMLVGLLFLVSASVIQMKLARKEKGDSNEVE